MHIIPLYFSWVELKPSTLLYLVHHGTFDLIFKCSSLNTMLQKLSKCEVEVWLCWNSIILPPLRFYVKSNFSKFKRSKNVILAILGILNFDFWSIWAFFKCQIYQNSNFRVSEIAKMTFLDRLNLPKFDFT